MNDATLVEYAQTLLSPGEYNALIEHNVKATGNNGLRKYLGSINSEAFLFLYFNDEFTVNLSPAHRDILHDIQQIRDRLVAQKPGLRMARAYPRGFGKSTYYSRILPIWGFLYGFSPLTVLIANNDVAAKRLVSNIKDIVESNDAIQEDFPAIRGAIWGSERIESTNNSVITAYGINSGSIRGTSSKSARPSIIIVDDPDDDVSARSAVQLATNIETFDKAISSMGDNVTYRTHILAVGTIIRKTSLMQYIVNSSDYHSVTESAIKRFATNEALWNDWQNEYLELSRGGLQPKDASEDTFYQSHKEELLAGTEVLWDRPDAYYYIMVYKLARGSKAFQSEMQNDPIDADSLLGAIPYVSLGSINEAEYDLLAALDPTTTGNKSSDLAAFVEVLFNRRRKEVVVSYVDAKQRSYGQTIDAVTRRIKTRGKEYKGFWIEENSSGLIIKDLINDKFKQNKIPLIANGIYHSQPKHDRIGILSEYMERGQLLFADTLSAEMNEELSMYPTTHDDILDAIATIVLYLKERHLLDLIQYGK